MDIEKLKAMLVDRVELTTIVAGGGAWIALAHLDETGGYIARLLRGGYIRPVELSGWGLLFEPTEQGKALVAALAENKE